MKAPFRPIHTLFMAALGGLTTMGEAAQAQPQSETPEPLTEIFSMEGADVFQDVAADNAMNADWADMAALDIEAAFELNTAAFGPGNGSKCYKPKKRQKASRGRNMRRNNGR